jgi:alkanesulfonate monooxygenase SsuD/methylene tetrahydromethanopterin reductase-like flavin-dependent oxidoreductase (luciferase family)
VRLSILDQSPVISGHDARRAIEETLVLARRADEPGYYRYWLAEHHAIAALADPCPEVLLARLGAETRRERRYVMDQRARAIIGGPQSCRARIQEMSARYGAEEVMVLTITGDYASRTRSYELLIEAFE